MMIDNELNKTKSRPWLIVCFFLFVATLFIYLPVIGYDFINYDDYEYVVENQSVNHGLTSHGIIWAFVSISSSNWHPVTWLSHMLDCQLYGLDAGKHHAINLILHISNVLLLFAVLYEAAGQIWPSAFVAAFFALHPTHVESVAWIAERKDVLSTFFMMVTFLFYTSYLKSRSRITYWLSVLFFALGLMSKPMLVTLPFLLLLFDYWPFKRFALNKKDFIQRPVFKTILLLVVEKIPFFILSGISSYITIIAQMKGGSIVSTVVYPLSVRFCFVIISYFEYIKKMFYPVNLSILYPYPEKVLWNNFYLSLFVLILVSVIVFYASRKKPYLAFGWLWYLGTLVPVIGIVQVGSQAMADRYTYIPYIGLFIMLIYSLFDCSCIWKCHRKIISCFLLSVLVFFAILTRFQLLFWRDSISVFQHAIKVTKENFVAYNNLGLAMIRKNGAVTEESFEYFSESARINPRFCIAHFNIGLYWASKNEDEKAIKSYLKVIEIAPDDIVAYCNIGNIYFKNGFINDAKEYYLKAIQRNANYAQAYNGVGAVYARQGDIENAVVFFQKALQLSPEYNDARANLESLLKIRCPSL